MTDKRGISAHRVTPITSGSIDIESTTSSRAELFRAKSTLSLQPAVAQPVVFAKKLKKTKLLKKPPTKLQIKFKQFARFFFKKFGMLIGTLLYCMGGAYLYGILEAQNELASCEGSQQDSKTLIEDYRTLIFNYLSFNVTFNPVLEPYITENYTLLDGPEIYNVQIQDWLIELRDLILENGYGGEDCDDSNSWQFLSALLWTLTVVTSIGYGHTSPKTWEGQVVLFCYALVGMPLFLLTCAEISTALADFYIILYKHVFCSVCNIYKNYKASHEEDEEEVEENCVPAPDDFMETPQSSTVLDENGEIVEALVLDSEENTDEEEDLTRVPFVIIIGTLIGFVIGGGYLFAGLEDWSVVEGVYYTYISISTVGFGDFSAGTSAMGDGELAKASRNLMIGTAFIVLGMSILGMCFSLMVDGLVDNIKMLLTKLGLLKPDDDDDSEENSQEMYVLEDDIDEEADQFDADKNDSKRQMKDIKQAIIANKSEPRAGQEFKKNYNKKTLDSSDSEASDNDYPHTHKKY